ncbi:hypothetical protein PG993_011670 [Apiospora rasikravindrae]|uniref:Uncharacterized protein n=1 Tax=Apiospora rasikravindrae TaxID=990691 RepID=A0ABR1S0A8_9PEZI
MSRLPLDSFLPSGAISDPNEYPLSYAKLANGVSPYSVISPLALPRSLSQTSYFDDAQLTAQAHHRSRPTATNGAGGVSSSQLPTSLHHQRQSRPSEQQPRQTSQHQPERFLSPNRSSSAVRDRNAMSPSLSSHISETGSGLISPSLVPFNDLSSPEQTALQLRRVTLQNRRLLENWEAERAHLEANRGRAEEIYKEERAIMDEERLAWADMEGQLRAQVRQLQQENQELRLRLEQQDAGRSHPVPEIRGGGSGSSEKMNSPSNGGIPAVKFQTFSAAGSPSSGPPGHTMPESNPFVPLDPRLQSMSPQNESGGSGTPSQEHVPSIDVQEILPHLEGIPLKSTAVQKATFTDGSSSRKESPTGSNSDSPAGSKSKVSPAEVTQSALRAPEQARLIMHAGHTPEPLHLSSFNRYHSDATLPELPRAPQASTNEVPQIREDPDAEEDRQLFEPSDGDRPLTGPLMIRNMPAKDEIFLQCVTDKLTSSLNENGATPTVLKGNPMEEYKVEEAQPKLSENVPAEGGNDSNSLGDDEPSDIPLKLRSTRNFGAPLGSIGNTGF